MRWGKDKVGRGLVLLRRYRACRDQRRMEPGEYFVHERPLYVSQIAGADRKKIEKSFGKIKDKKAMKRFGAKDLSEFSYWAWRACAISDVEMIIRTAKGKTFEGTTMGLVEECLELGGYEVRSDTGWYHGALVELLRRHGFEAKRFGYWPLEMVAGAISGGNYVIGSVVSDNNTGTPSHMVLIYGVKMGEDGEVRGFWCHDPGNYKRAGEGVFISSARLKKVFLGKGIVVRE